MIHYFLESLSISCLDIEHSARIVLEATHALDVLCYTLGLELSQDVPHKTHSVEWLLHSELESHAVFSSIEQTTSLHFLLVVTREEGECLAESQSHIAFILLDEVVGGLSEHGDDLLVHFFKLLNNAH